MSPLAEGGWNLINQFYTVISSLSCEEQKEEKTNKRSFIKYCNSCSPTRKQRARCNFTLRRIRQTALRLSVSANQQADDKTNTIRLAPLSSVQILVCREYVLAAVWFDRSRIILPVWHCRAKL